MNKSENENWSVVFMSRRGSLIDFMPFTRCMETMAEFSGETVCSCLSVNYAANIKSHTRYVKCLTQVTTVAKFTGLPDEMLHIPIDLCIDTRIQKTIGRRQLRKGKAHWRAKQRLVLEWQKSEVVNYKYCVAAGVCTLLEYFSMFEH